MEWDTITDTKMSFYKIKKTQYSINQIIEFFNCGDAENRTRVQTSGKKAFYIYSSYLIVGLKLIKNNPF